MARRLTRAIVRASPKPRSRRGSGRGGSPAARILDEDLVARSTRASRIRDSGRRRARRQGEAGPWLALLFVGASVLAIGLLLLRAHGAG